MIPASEKAAFNKDAAKAMDVMNKLTGGPGGKSQGVSGAGTGGDENIGTNQRAETWQAEEFSDPGKVKPAVDKTNNDDAAANQADVDLPGDDGDYGPEVKDKTDQNVRTGTQSYVDDSAYVPLVRQHTKNQTKTDTSIKRNVLHKYSSYTYHFELFVLDVDDYNRITNDETFRIEEQEKRLLIKSGGGGQKMRNKYFQLDYFIDDVNIDSVMSPSSGNAGSTNVEVSFTITEPYGMTLLNALVMACKEMGGYNYTNQPYLLKISFKGYDKDGLLIEGAQPESTRYIPIKIRDFKFGATEAGTTYNISAIPYHSLALENTKATIKTDVRVDATTIGSFLSNSIQTVTTNIVPGVPTAGAGQGSGQYLRTGQSSSGRSAVITKTPSTTTKKIDTVEGGLAGYFNLIEAEQVKQGTKLFPDEYVFTVDPDISSATIMPQDLTEIRKIKNENDPRKKAKGQLLKNFQYDESSQSYSIRAGTNVIQCIHSIIKTSSYMTNQVKADNLQLVPDKQFSEYKENQDTPINFYRIVPKITLLKKWDTKRNCYARKVEYIIKKYNMYGKDFENFGQAPITDVIKDYKYLYTGQNDDVLNFDIQFNSAYYQTNLYNIANKAKNVASQKAQYDPSDFAAGNLAKTDANSVSTIAPFIKESYVDTGSSKGVSDPRGNPRAMLVDNFMQEVFKNGADLIEASLEIVGDPCFINQNDQTQIGLMTYEAPPYLNDRSLNPDREWHISMSFRNPVDINTETGLYYGFGHDKDGLAEVTAPTMNGIYRAVEVNSKFQGGKFTQSIKAIRERGKQLSDLVDSSETAKRVETVKEINQKVDTLVMNAPHPGLKLLPKGPAGIPLPDDFDKTITGSNAVQSAIDKAGSIGKAFPDGNVKDIGDVMAISGAEENWKPKATGLAKKAGSALLKSARTIAT